MYRPPTPRCCPRIRSLTVLLAAALGTSATAQTASYELFGSGCNGARVDKLSALNEGTTTDFGTLLFNEYAVPVRNTTQVTQSIQGFAIVTRTVGNQSAQIRCGLYRDQLLNGTGNHSNPLPAAEGMTVMTVDPSYNWYRCFFPEPMVVAPGEAFWISFDHTPIEEPDANPGQPVTPTVQWRAQPFNGVTNNWAPTTFIPNPIYRLFGLDGGGMGTLTTADVPQIGTTVTFNITGRSGAQAGLLITGTDDKSALGVPLPLNLAPFRMRGCTLYTWQVLPLQGFAMIGGTGSVTAAVPNDPNLVGLTVFHQAVLVTPGANAPGLLFTNGGRGVIGT